MHAICWYKENREIATMSVMFFDFPVSAPESYTPIDAKWHGKSSLLAVASQEVFSYSCQCFIFWQQHIIDMWKYISAGKDYQMAQFLFTHTMENTFQSPQYSVQQNQQLSSGIPHSSFLPLGLSFSRGAFVVFVIFIFLLVFFFLYFLIFLWHCLEWGTFSFHLQVGKWRADTLEWSNPHGIRMQANAWKCCLFGMVFWRKSPLLCRWC